MMENVFSSLCSFLALLLLLFFFFLGEAKCNRKLEIKRNICEDWENILFAKQLWLSENDVSFFGIEKFGVVYAEKRSCLSLV